MRAFSRTDTLTLLTLLGAATGFCARQFYPGHPFLFLFVITAGILFVLAFEDGPKNTLKAALYALGVSAFLSLCWWWRAHGGEDGSMTLQRHFTHDMSFDFFFYSKVFCIVSLAFFIASLRTGRWNAPYPLVCQAVWDRPIITAGAWLFVLLMWLVLVLWMRLFSIMGVSIFKELFLKPGFIAAYGGAAFSLGVAVLDGNKKIVGATRTLFETLFALVTPLLALIVTLFFVFLPVTGLAPLWSTGHASIVVAALLALGILCINAVIGSEGRVASALLSVSARVLAIALPFLFCIGLWSLAVRIDHNGLSPQRIHALVLLGMAGLFALTYAVAAALRWKEGWEDALRSANTGCAVIVLAVCAFMLTPFADTARLTAWQQTNALLSGRVRVEQFDFGYLAYGLGRAGEQAIDDIRARALTHKEGAKILAGIQLAQTSNNARWRKHAVLADQPRLTNEKEIRAVYDVKPAGRALPVWLFTMFRNDNIALLGQSCAKTAAQRSGSSPGRCVLVLADLFGDAQDEVLFVGPFGPVDALYRTPAGKIESLKFSFRGTSHSYKKDILEQDVVIAPSKAMSLHFGDTIIDVTPPKADAP